MAWSLKEESSAVASVLPLLLELGNNAPLNDDYWRRLFGNDALRVLRGDDQSVARLLLRALGATGVHSEDGPPPLQHSAPLPRPGRASTNVKELFEKAASLVELVVARRAGLPLPPSAATSGGSVPAAAISGGGLGTELARACSALHLCGLVVRCASAHFSPHDAAVALGRIELEPQKEAAAAEAPALDHESSFEPLVLLTDATIDLVAWPQVNGLFYDAMLEGVHFLLALLATQNTTLCRGSSSHSSGNHDDHNNYGHSGWTSFETSPEEDTGRGLALAQRKEAYEAAVRAQAYSRQQMQQKQQKQQQQEQKERAPAAPSAASAAAAAAPEAAGASPSAPFLVGWFGFGGSNSETPVVATESTVATAGAAATAAATTAIANIATDMAAAADSEGATQSNSKVDLASDSPAAVSAPTPLLPPQPTLPPRTHYGLEIVLCGSRNRNSSKEGSREHLVRREAQAARLVEAVLTWLAQRPLPPQPLATAPAAARAVEAESMVASERKSARGAHRSTYSAFGNGGALAFFRGSGSGAGGGYGGSYDDLPNSGSLYGGSSSSRSSNSSSRALTLATPFRLVAQAPKQVVLAAWAIVAAVFLSLTRVLALLRAAELLRFSSVEPPRPRTTNGGFAAVFNDIEGGGGTSNNSSSNSSNVHLVGAKTKSSSYSSRYSGDNGSTIVGGLSGSGSSGSTSVEGSSPLVERGQMLLLLLVHNDRASGRFNPFRAALTAARDPRYSDLFDTPSSNTTTTTTTTGAGASLPLASVPASKLSSTSSITTSTAAAAVVQPAEVSFEALFFALGRALPSDARGEPAALMLYTLLHGHRHFSQVLLARSDLDTLVLPLLERLYHAPDTPVAIVPPTATATALTSNNSVNHHRPSGTSSSGRSSGSGAPSVAALYVGVIVLLTFTQDAGFGGMAFQHLTIPAVPWYQERYMRDVSLGSLSLLVTLRALVHTLAKLNDFYLVETLLACLGNMAPHVERLHPYAAQRLVAVAIMALKKCHAYIRRFDACQVALLSNGSRSSSATSGSSTGEKFAVSSPSSSLMCENGGDDDGSATAASAAGAPAAANAASAASVAELSSLVHVYGQCACGLVALLNAGLRPKALSKNPELVYALMHRKGDFLAAAHMYVPPTTTAASNDGVPSAYSDEPAWAPMQGSPSESIVAALRALLAPLPPLLHHLEASLAEAASASTTNIGATSTSMAAHGHPNSTGLPSSGGVLGASVSDGRSGGGGRSSDLSVEATRSVLADSAMTFARAQQGDVAADEQWLPQKVCYQEQAEPEAFFVPYAWEVAGSHTKPDLFWGLEA